MASVWPVYEGREPTSGGPWAILPVSDAIKLFDLRPDDFVSDLGQTPRFGDASRELSHAGFKYIVVEIRRDEGSTAGWRPGFYKSGISPDEAFGILIKHALTTELGAENVRSVHYEPTTDSRGNDALRIIVIVETAAIERLGKGAPLNALIRLREQLSEMQEQRVPIIEYSTEEELAQDGSP